MAKKRILIVTEYFYPEEFKVNEVALAWYKKGYEVDVLTQNPTYPYGKVFENYTNSWYSIDNYQGVKVYRVKAVTGYKDSLFKKLLKYFTFMSLGSFISLKIGKKYDYVFGFDVGPLTGMVPAVVLQKFYGIKVTLWVQDVWPDSVYAYGFKKRKFLTLTLNAFVRFVYKHTSYFAISGKGFKEKLEPYLVNKQKIQYLPNWGDNLNMDLSPFEFSKEKKIHFTFAGNIGKVQNLDIIIKAFGNLSDEYNNKAQLNLIGDGSHLEALKNLVKSKNIKNVVFWGRKPREEIFSYLDGSDFLLVSLVDKPIFSLTVPAKIQTYIAASKPIMAVINGDAADIIEENNLGFVTHPNDKYLITQTFMKCIDCDEKKILDFTKNCEKLTSTVFNKNKVIDSLLNLTIG